MIESIQKEKKELALIDCSVVYDSALLQHLLN